MKKLVLLFSVLMALAAGRAALAEEEFDLKIAKGEVLVVTKGHWHVNKDYPWKVIVEGGQAFDKSHFILTETSAQITGVPHGSARLKGAVCNGPQCMPFTKEITIE